MKTHIIVIAFLLMLIGCATYQPVSSMTDCQLESEQNRLQIKQSKLKRALRYGRPLNISIRIRGTAAHTRAKLRLKTIENRIREVENEMLRRQKMDE